MDGAAEEDPEPEPAATAATAATTGAAAADEGRQSSRKRSPRRRAARPMDRALWPNRKFWGLVLRPEAGGGDVAQQAGGKEQLVSREYHLHITQATILLDENATRSEAAAARAQLWVTNCNTGEAGAEEDTEPRLVCSLSASGRESQKLSLQLSGQRVKLVAVGCGCELHLSGCLEKMPEEAEEEDSDEDTWDGDSDSDSETESGSGSDTVAGKKAGGGRGSLADMLSSNLGDSDDSDDDEDFSYPEPDRPDSPE